MSRSRDSSSDASRDESLRLPPIRHILGNELSNSPRQSHRTLESSFILDPLRSALSDDSSTRKRSHDSDRHYALSMNRSASAASQLQSSYPGDHHGQRLPPASSLVRGSAPMYPSEYYNGVPTEYRGSGHPDVGHYSSHRGSERSSQNSRPTLVSNVDWGGHRRHDSTESAWSSYSSSSSASSHAQSSAASSTLQFQPLPHAHMNASRPPHKHNPTHPANSSNSNYHSPYGVLISDADQPGALAADPQRTAILRTLKADGPHGTFSLEDPRVASSARYECTYCQKRFNRPSSLKIHLNSHTGEKPFQCVHPNCGRRFSVQSNMRRHARVHQQGRKTTESSGDDDLGEGDSSRSHTPPSSSQSSRPTLSRLDVDDIMSRSDSEDSEDSNLRTAHPVSNSRRGPPSPRSHRQ